MYALGLRLLYCAYMYVYIDIYAQFRHGSFLFFIKILFCSEGSTANLTLMHVFAKYIAAEEV